MKKITVTGTKGKTTVVNVVASVLQALDQNVLKVDTTGHFVNGKRKSTMEDSKTTWKLVPTVCPGRYLWEFHANKELEKNGVAVLEAAVGSSRREGLGYRTHEVGVFLNVFEDHLGSSTRLKTRKDIAQAKSFIFTAIAKQGYAVFNADDELVCSALSVIDPEFETKFIPCGLTFDHFDIEKHLKNGGVAVSREGEYVVIKNKSGSQKIVNLNNIPWAFKGTFTPSVYNVMHSVGALYAYFEGELPDNFQSIFESVRLDPYGGRLTLLKAKNGCTILADYAHEKQSLAEVASLARSLVGDNGSVIGVVRMAHDRPDSVFIETGHVIADNFDKVIVYDKIDGNWRKPVNQQSLKFPQVTGRTSKILAEAVGQQNTNVERIIREDEAIEKAASIATKNDVVVMIVNDDINRSIDFIKKSFQADFV